MHKPILFTNLTLSFPHKTCFSAFNSRILYGNRIAIIGSNGCGKSTLLNILRGKIEPSDGEIHLPKDLKLGYLPQVIESDHELSGGQRLNRALTQALMLEPDLLLLDEPTNHLDQRNRRSLKRMLKTFFGTLIVVTHDVELLRESIDTIWHIDNGRIYVFSGHYDDYIVAFQQQRIAIEKEIVTLNQQKKDVHDSRMREQERIAKSRASGEKKIANRKWLKMVGDLKGMKAEKSQGKKQSAIHHKKQELMNQLSELRCPEVIKPKFVLNATLRQQALVSIQQGQVGYNDGQPVLTNINLNISGNERVALLGDNASGKSTLIKAILSDPALLRTGVWYTPEISDIGYLDQHYTTLTPDKTVIDVIMDALPQASYLEIRKHLNDFLFRKNEEVQATISTLSGGERARLSLAKIAAISPKLLILDEMTNNLDLETRAHVIDVLHAYPGAMIIISHDVDFLKEIHITTYYQISDGKIEPYEINHVEGLK